MPSIVCPTCHQQSEILEGIPGKFVRCKTCHSIFRVIQASTPSDSTSQSPHDVDPQQQSVPDYDWRDLLTPQADDQTRPTTRTKRTGYFGVPQSRSRHYIYDSADAFRDEHASRSNHTSWQEGQPRRHPRALSRRSSLRMVGIVLILCFVITSFATRRYRRYAKPNIELPGVRQFLNERPDRFARSSKRDENKPRSSQQNIRDRINLEIESRVLAQAIRSELPGGMVARVVDDKLQCLKFKKRVRQTFPAAVDYSGLQVISMSDSFANQHVQSDPDRDDWIWHPEFEPLTGISINFHPDLEPAPFSLAPATMDLPYPNAVTARPGYSVGGVKTLVQRSAASQLGTFSNGQARSAGETESMEAAQAWSLSAIQVVFMKRQGNRLNPDDSYASQWFGESQSGNHAVSLLSDGRIVCGLVLDEQLQAFGLILAADENR